jgi:hypothetical protein
MTLISVLSEIQFRIYIFRGGKSANNTKAATHYKKRKYIVIGDIIGEDCKEPGI